MNTRILIDDFWIKIGIMIGCLDRSCLINDNPEHVIKYLIIVTVQ